MRLRAAHLWLTAALAVLAGARAASLDLNGDGTARIALLSVPQHPGGLDAATLCADLDQAVKASRPGRPSRVTLEPLTRTRSLLGWWYHPDEAAARDQVLRGRYDLLLLAESEEVVGRYPELFFEGVRAISERAAAAGIRCALVLLAKPAESFRDRRAESLAATAYRVGDGCGVGVVPAAFGWTEALSRNRITGNSPVRLRAYTYLAAAAIYCDLADERLPKAALETDWTTKRLAEPLALSAREAVQRARVTQHYAGPFQGVVRIEPRLKPRLKIYAPSAVEDDPLRLNLQAVLDAAFQEWFWRTPGDWYRDGFDRNACPFDLVLGERGQMETFLDRERYTSRDEATTNQSACLAVYVRNPGGNPDGADVLRHLEGVLMEGYDFARQSGQVFIPYQVAWARAWQQNPELVRESAPGRMNDWLAFMLAHMAYTLITDRYQPPTERAKPSLSHAEHPRGYHEACARIGFDTMRQLARLSTARNALLLRTETYRLDGAAPGFVALRLLDRPSSPVSVLCATDVPGAATLSRDTLVFAPETFDIEQAVRLLPATNAPAFQFHFMAAARTEDAALDGASDLRPFLLNAEQGAEAGFAFERDSLSPALGYQVGLAPSVRPTDLVCVRLVRNGLVAEEVYFSQDSVAPRRVRLVPTAAEYAAGQLAVALRVESPDRRFNGRQFDFTFRVSDGGAPLPTVDVRAPARDALLDGPAFVTARAAASSASGGVAEVALFLGHKRLGRAAGQVCEAPVEQGPPQSRLGPGAYTLWATAAASNGVRVASEPLTFQVRERETAAGGEPPRPGSGNGN